MSCSTHVGIPYLFILPSFLLLFALIIYPTFFVMSNSFYFWNLQTSPVPMQFVGLKNFEMVFTVTPVRRFTAQHAAGGIYGTFIEFWLGMGIALAAEHGRARQPASFARC